MKKYIAYVIAAIIGIAIGAIFFGGGNGTTNRDAGGSLDDQAEHDHGQVSEKWSCSMHPQIQKLKPGKCPICAMDLTLLAKGKKNDQNPREFVMSQAAKELAKISTVPVERRFVDARIHLVGKIDYDETRTKTIAAWFPARIDKLYVDYTGVDVIKGDHLAYVYSPDLLTAQRELISAIKFQSEDVDTIKDKLRLWGLSEEKIRSIEVKGETDDHMDIDAPSGGIVIHKGVNEGDYVKTGEPLFRIADLSKVWVQLDAYESDLPWLRYGQKVEFEAEAVPGRKFSGTVTFISPIMDPATRTVKVRVNADNEGFLLKPDMFVRAAAFATLAGGGKVIGRDLADKWIGPMHPEILQDKPGNCPICGMKLKKAGDLGYTISGDPDKAPLVIPASAVLKTGKRSVVYVEVPDRKEPTYEGREVLIGPRAGAYYIVEEGLEEGEKVVVEGSFKIDSALQILAKPSMMNPKGGGGGGGHQHGQKARPAEEGEKKKEEPDEVYEVDDEFKQQLTRVFGEFFKLQSALATDDMKKARAASISMTKSLEGVDMKLLKGDAHHAWMKFSASLRESTGKLEAAKEIGSVRKEFEGLSSSMSQLAVGFAMSFAEPAVIAHCPMAFDGKGADWLQKGKEVRNPYFGKEMLECGAVKKELGKPAKK